MRKGRIRGKRSLLLLVLGLSSYVCLMYVVKVVSDSRKTSPSLILAFGRFPSRTKALALQRCADLTSDFQGKSSGSRAASKSAAHTQVLLPSYVYILATILYPAIILYPAYTPMYLAVLVPVPVLPCGGATPEIPNTVRNPRELEEWG